MAPSLVGASTSHTRAIACLRPGTPTTPTTRRCGCRRWCRFQGGNVYTGKIYQNSGPRFDAYDTTKVTANSVGTATITFADGNNATFGYVVMVAPFPGPVTQSKQITRFPFAATGGTACH